jgi:hypothetical protein
MELADINQGFIGTVSNIQNTALMKPPRQKESKSESLKLPQRQLCLTKETERGFLIYFSGNMYGLEINLIESVTLC